MSKVACIIKREGLSQGDILRNVPYVESIHENDGHLEVSVITFPYAIVVSQECDLQWDYAKRPEKFDLISALLIPLYNYEHVLSGVYLERLGTTMGQISRKEKSTDNKNLRRNETPRYHYIDFPDEIDIVPSVADFKQYFTVCIDTLLESKKNSYVCTLDTPFKEHLVQRFTNYLSRIGLPTIDEVASNHMG